MLRNFSVTTSTITDKPQAYAGFLAGTAGFATTTRQLLEENERPDHPARPRSAARHSALLARYSPEYPCLLQGLAQSNDFIGKTFANGELHITLEVTRARTGYQPGEEPAWGENRGPDCYGLPNPPRPWPGNHFRDGTQRRRRAPARSPGFLLDPQSGTGRLAPRSRASSTRCSRPQMGVPAGDVPDLATLLFGPMARGTAVSQS